MKNTWRPEYIEEIFGQDHIKPLLLSWQNHPDKIPQSLLLQGGYGNGKTSVARILAKSLASTSDIHEHNAASERGIDDIRMIAESTVFKGRSGSKVYIIDELHELTKNAQQALLKVIEEPPSGIYFFLCTTEPSKLLPTIRSRCQQLEVRNFKQDDMNDLVNYLTEGKMPPELAQQIYRSTGGHARDAVKCIELWKENGDLSQYTSANSFHITSEEANDFLNQCIKSKGVDFERAMKIIDNGDPYMLATVLDDFVNYEFLRTEVIRNNYCELLYMRAYRQEYKIKANDQWRHLLAIFTKEWLV